MELTRAKFQEIYLVVSHFKTVRIKYSGSAGYVLSLPGGIKSALELEGAKYLVKQTMGDYRPFSTIYVRYLILETTHNSGAV
jgi:hypothetical protein